MSPAAAELRSPIHSPQSKLSSSTVQNTSSMPDATSHPSFNYAGFSYVKCKESTESLNPSSFDNASDRGFATVVAPPGQSGTGSAASARSRPRPRLVKLRKQSASQHARSRSRTAAIDVGSGFNPFRQASESSDQVKSYNSMSNGLMDSFIGVESVGRVCNGIPSNCHMKFGNTEFVFGAKRSESTRDLNSKLGAAAESREERGVINEKEMELSKSDNVEFVFSAKRSDMESNSSQEIGETSKNASNTVSGDERKLSEPVQVKFGSWSFAFYADQNNLASNSHIEEEESSKTGKTSNFNLEKQESLDCTGKCNHGVCTLNTNTETNSNCNALSNLDDHLSNDKCKSQHGSTNDISSACSTVPSFKLPDEMKKLNINDSEEVGNADFPCDLNNASVNSSASFVFGSGEKASGSFGVSTGTNSDGQQSCPDAAFANASVNSSASFVFGHSEKASGSFSVSTGTNSEGQQSCPDASFANASVNSSASFVFRSSEKASGSFSVSTGTNSEGQQSCPDAAFANIDGQHFKTFETSSAQNGTGCHITSNSTGVSCSEPVNGLEGIRHGGKIPESEVPEDSPLDGGATTPFSFSSFSLNSHVFTANFMHTDQNECDTDNTSIPEGCKESFMDFKPPLWDPSCFQENLFPKLNKKLESTQKGRSFKEKRLKQMRRKLKPHSLNKNQTRQDHLSKESNSLKTSDSPCSYSPMDFSPYQETRADDQDINSSADLKEPSIPDQGYVPSSLHSTFPTDYKDEHLGAVGRGVDTDTTDHKYGDPNKSGLLSCDGNSYVGDPQSSDPEIVRPNLKSEQVSNSSMASASVDAAVDFSSNTDRQNTDQFWFAHGLGEEKGKHFTFSASSSGESIPSSFKRKQKKKFRKKVGCDSFVVSPNPNGNFGSSVQISLIATANMTSHSDVMDRSKIDDQFKEGEVASSATIEETCDKWRLRGNQAYKDGDLSKAEDFYTLGINSIPSTERLGCCIKPLLLCYSNRAATRMGLGRIRDALGDCLAATALDPTFLKVQIRTANCYLLLGEVQNAHQCFNECLESGNAVCLDRRIVVEAAEGLQKAQKVTECTNNSAELLKERDSNAAAAALELLTNALSISLYSEKLLEMKAEALYLLQKYEAAIHLCEQSQYLAEKNFGLANNAENLNILTCNSYLYVRLWRWLLISKCYFHLGRLETSLDTLEKLQQDVSVNNKCGIENIEESLSLAATIRELMYRKSAGNESFKLGKYTEAIEHYTVALSSNIQSRPFAAICFCNRAAAHQALGQIADAISDCSMAMALDGNYAKAISRRATLHEMVRDYEQAACDLRRLIPVIESQSDERTKHSGTPSGSNGGVKELRQVHQQLLSVEDQAKKEIPLDFYLILGIKTSDTATDIKKAYHKAALRHHPDKAGQLLARSDVGDEGQVWKEISQQVHEDADRLFKLIAEAYAVLSDPAKRNEYDFEEEIRKASKQSNGGSRNSRYSDVQGYGGSYPFYRSPFDRNSSRRQGRDHWKTHGSSYSRW